MHPSFLSRQTISILILSFLIKLLLIPSYFSTDFDVHRNWLRITSNLPLTSWYTDTLSPWTLDYPPFFAYFEYFLSLVSSLVSPSITSPLDLTCHTPSCIYFQRISVLLSELVYFAALLYAINNKHSRCKKLMVLFLQFGFVLLDNVHFQYNSMMQGILIFSIEFMLQGRVLRGAFVFACLLNFKHIYFYVAPVYFVYIMGQYVMKEEGGVAGKVKRFVGVAVVTLVPFVLSFGPFVVMGGVEQIGIILERLFPFGRGLVHSYWAPNFWAFYCALDRLLAALLQNKIYLIQNFSPSLRILPQISPFTSLLFVLIPSSYIYFQCYRSPNSFTKSLILSGLLFCFFGYHVHQKAFLVYINLLLLYGGEKYWNQVLVNSVSLLPLLWRAYERVVKIVGLVLYMGVWGKRQNIRDWKEKFIVVTGGLIVVFHEVVHPWTTLRFYFLPLMMYSIWAGVFYGWIIAELYGEVLRGKWKWSGEQIGEGERKGYQMVAGDENDI